MKKSHSMIKRVSWLLLPLFMSLPYTAQAQISMFLDLAEGGIQGESQDTAYRGQIDVMGFSEGITSTGATNGGAGRANAHALNVYKYLDRSSPALRQSLANGTTISKAVLTVTRDSVFNGGSSEPFAEFIITLEKLRVTKISMSASNEEDRLTEQVELTFAKIKWKYTTLKADGKKGEDFEAGWNFEENRSFE
jgi:type VI secretion system secreted protein Hcp